MTLQARSRLGPYEVIAPLGAGGMGEVYRARDTRLDREVAIKVLPEAVAADPDRLARFEREARAVAALSHPNIVGLHDFDRANGVTYAVMELLDGATLREWLHAGPLSIRKAVEIAVQVCRGLSAAHDKGLVHRDLKPENVFLLNDGHAKILDFGLTRVLPPAGDNTVSVGTDPGVVLGTVGYMSPEQVRGQPTDERTDLFALGTVLYEMLTGQRPFRGTTAAETMSAILRDDPPDVVTLRPEVPPALDRIVRHCLEKNTAERFQTARDVGFALDALSGASASGARAVADPVQPLRTRPRSMGWTAAGACLAAVAAFLIGWAPWRNVPPSPSLRITAHIGADGSLMTMSAQLYRVPGVVVSPDGKVLAFVARARDGRSQIYVRRLDQLQATALSGTDGAVNPFFSPDSESIGFFAQGELRKVSIAGGAPISLARMGVPVSNVRGAWWSEDGTIVFQQSGTAASLQRIAATGGDIGLVGEPQPDVITERWPQVLPGAEAVLFTTHDSFTNFDRANLAVRRLPDGKASVVVTGGYHGRYVASGHILYMNEARLMAVPFDLAGLRVTGPSVPVLQGIDSSAGNAAAHFSVSRTGMLVYVSGASLLGGEGQIGWLAESGRITPLRTAVYSWSFPKFSPDGQALAMTLIDGTQFHTWIYDWTHDHAERLAFDASNDLGPVWSPSGRTLMVAAGRDVSSNLYVRRVDRIGTLQRLTTSDRAQIPWSWHRSGRFVAITEANATGKGGRDVKILTLDGNDENGWRVASESVLVETASDYAAPAFSPDGRWIAYVALDEGSRSQVFVRPFPNSGGPWQVSTDSGYFPVWSETRPELFFGGPDERVMRVNYAADNESFRLTNRPAVWTTTPYRGSGVGRPFDLHPDGRRFAIKPVLDESASPTVNQVVIVSNFFDELRRVAPVKP